jgi:glycosyltransferase involved in cell wall biosynthesis
MAQTVAACLVIYNEEKVLDRCLASLKGVVDEIVIAHDGVCTDASLEIAKRYGARVFEREHAGFSEAHRIFTIEQSTSDWVMWIDADEYLPADTAAAIPELIQKKDVDAVSMIWPLWDGKRQLTKQWPYRGILFRKSKLSFFAFPHQHFQTTGEMLSVPLVMMHEPSYNNYTLKTFFTKWRRWARIQATMFKEKPFSDIPKYQYDKTEWPRDIRILLKYPILFPVYGAACAYHSIRAGSWKEGWIGIKQSLLFGGYQAMVFFYVLKPARK